MAEGHPSGIHQEGRRASLSYVGFSARGVSPGLWEPAPPHKPHTPKGVCGVCGVVGCPQTPQCGGFVGFVGFVSRAPYFCRACDRIGGAVGDDRAAFDHAAQHSPQLSGLALSRILNDPLPA